MEESGFFDDPSGFTVMVDGNGQVPVPRGYEVVPRQGMC